MAIQLVNNILGVALELIFTVYREVHTHSFILKHLLQWLVHDNNWHPGIASLRQGTEPSLEYTRVVVSEYFVSAVSHPYS